MMEEEQNRETCGYDYYLFLQYKRFIDTKKGRIIVKSFDAYSFCCNQEVLISDYFELVDIERGGGTLTHALLCRDEYPDVCLLCKHYKPLEEEARKSITKILRENNIH